MNYIGKLEHHVQIMFSALKVRIHVFTFTKRLGVSINP